MSFAIPFLIGLGSLATTMGEAIPPEVLNPLKDATVLVRISAGESNGSGSGFVVKVDGTAAYVVTNHHVISGPKKGRSEASSVKLVFYSGTSRQFVTSAQVLAVDPVHDLAVLRAEAASNLPRPLAWDQVTEVAETMDVVVLGFPFGEALAGGNANPTITINRGSISSLRRDETGKLSFVQIDGALNPGNSGGPVVDSQGRLIGVAMATVPGAQIGLTIPAQHVAALLDGRVVRTIITVQAVRSDFAELAIEAQLLDPFGRIPRVTFRFIRTDALGSVVKPDRGGSWPALPGAQTLALKVEPQKAVGTLKVPAGDRAARSLMVQTSYVNSQGRTVFTAPVSYSINPTAITRGQDRTKPSPDGEISPRVDLARAQNPADGSPEPRQRDAKEARSSKASKARRHAGGQLAAAKPSPARETETFIDLKFRKVPLRQGPISYLVWAADGRSFYCGSVGEIYRFNLEDLRQLARWRPVNRQVNWLSPSAEGLLMLCGNDPVEIWILDPETFEVRSKLTARDVDRVVSAPSLSVAYGLKGQNRGISQETLVVFDLKKGTMVRELNTRSFPSPVGYGMATVSPDGKSLYTVYSDAAMGSRLQRFQIDKTRLKYVATSLPTRRSLRKIAISPDSKLVALPVGRDVEQPAKPGLPAWQETELFVFRSSNLSRPALTLRSRPGCVEFLEFDSRSGGFIASGNGFILFDRTGKRRNSVPAGSFTEVSRQEIIHPEGHTILKSLDGLYVISIPE
jgi:S1-C subfamily serine protease